MMFFSILGAPYFSIKRNSVELPRKVHDKYYQRYQMTKPCKQHIGMPDQDEMLNCAEPSLVEAQDQDWDMPAHRDIYC